MKYLVCRCLDNGRYQNPYDGSPRIWHESFEIAKQEAERLCQKEEKDFIIISEVARIKPQPKTVFEDYREK